MSNFMEHVKAIAPTVEATSTISVIRKQSDTVEQARAKVIKKLNDSIAYVEAGMIAKVRPIELTFQPEAGGTFAVGARYGIRWLPNLAGSDKRFVSNVTREQLAAVLRAAAEAVNDGQFDDDLLLIQKQNAERMRKAA